MRYAVKCVSRYDSTVGVQETTCSTNINISAEGKQDTGDHTIQCLTRKMRHMSERHFHKFSDETRTHTNTIESALNHVTAICYSTFIPYDRKPSYIFINKRKAENIDPFLQIHLRQKTRELEYKISSTKHKCDTVKTTHFFNIINL